MKCAVAPAPKACMALRLKSRKPEKGGTVFFYCEAFNYLLKAYITDPFIVETNADMMPFTQPKIELLAELAKALLRKVHRCKGVFANKYSKELQLRDYWNPSVRVCVFIGFQESRYSP